MLTEKLPAKQKAKMQLRQQVLFKLQQTQDSDVEQAVA